MQARETALKELLEGDKLYVVPKYQRRYAWQRGDWEHLWNAVERQYGILQSGADAPKHFLGSIVYGSHPFFPTEAPNFQVIDGQQRLATLMILLSALRDGIDDDQLRDKVDSHVRNRYEPKYDHKFLAGEQDRHSFDRLFAGEAEKSSGLPLSGYSYMTSRIAELAERDADFDPNLLLRAAVERLEVVQILTGTNDNAHRIFQTLNSTGKALSAVDLLRNHFFMLLPNQVDQAYSEIWSPMEKRLGERFGNFLWIELVCRPGFESVPNKTERIYASWQTILDPMAGDEGRVLAELRTLADRAEWYGHLREPSTGHGSLDAALSELVAWGTEVHYPLSFLVLERLRSRSIDSDSAAEALTFVLGFLCRRMLAGIPTNNLNRIFTTSVGQLSEIAGADFGRHVRRVLSQPGKYWPGDEVLTANVLKNSFYETQRAAQRQFVLRRLEARRAEPYAPDWQFCNFTVEHIMPKKATDWWVEHLRDSGEEDPIRAHEELAHTLGNLTVTCENSALGTMNFGEKKAIYASDIVKMNSDIAEEEQWAREEIRRRSERLAELAVDIWAGPLESTELELHELASEIRGVLLNLPEGRWTTASAMAEFLDRSADVVSDALQLLGANPERALVLDDDGSIPVPTWADQPADELLAELVGRGVIQTADETPSTESFIGASELGSLEGSVA